MKNFKLNASVKAFSIAGVFAVAALGATDLRSSQADFADSHGQSAMYALTVNDAVAVTQLVKAVGGEISNVASGVGSVQASLTQEQLELVSRSNFITRVSAQPEGSSATLSSAVDNQVNQVAGVWWNR
jgi:hypothetical protein